MINQACSTCSLTNKSGMWKFCHLKWQRLQHNFRGKTPTLATCYPIIACLGVCRVTVTCFTPCTVGLILICLVRLLTVLCSSFYFVLWLICLLVMTPYSFQWHLIGGQPCVLSAKETRCERPDLVALRWRLGTGKRLQKKFLGRVSLATV